ncbi:MAG: hypothetical protein ABIG44_00230 [Planctomycetota bacterium]
MLVWTLAGRLAYSGRMDADLFDERDAPRCLECDYILIGLPGDRCPECGTRINWEAVRAAILHTGLPVERRRGWGRLVGVVQTWALVLFRPRTFARRVSERFSVWPATFFALGCMAIGVLGNTYLGLDQAGSSMAIVAWIIGCWFHIECQSLLFWGLDWRSTHRLRLWLFWRKVSLYTTAFVTLDWLAGPPMIEGYTQAGNFPWILDWNWRPISSWWPPGSNEFSDLARGVAYYWWMGVLIVTLWIRLRRKWCLLIILAAMPGITLLSCEVGYRTADMLDELTDWLDW